MWTARERDELKRLKVAFGRDLYEQAWIEGTTDRGDPWVVAIDVEEDALVLHIARLGTRYVALDGGLTEVAVNADLAAFVDACIAHVRRALRPAGPNVLPFRASRGQLAAFAALLVELARQKASEAEAASLAQDAHGSRAGTETTDAVGGRLVRPAPPLPIPEARPTTGEASLTMAITHTMLMAATVEFLRPVSASAGTTATVIEGKVVWLSAHPMEAAGAAVPMAEEAEILFDSSDDETAEADAAPIEGKAVEVGDTGDATPAATGADPTDEAAEGSTEGLPAQTLSEERFLFRPASEETGPTVATSPPDGQQVEVSVHQVAVPFRLAPGASGDAPWPDAIEAAPMIVPRVLSEISPWPVRALERMSDTAAATYAALPPQPVGLSNPWPSERFAERRQEVVAELSSGDADMPLLLARAQALDGPQSRFDRDVDWKDAGEALPDALPLLDILDLA